MNLEQLKAKLIANAEAMSKIVSESSDSLSDEQQKQIDDLVAENATLEQKVKNLEAVQAAEATAKKMSNRPVPKLEPLVPASAIGGVPSIASDDFKIPASARRHGMLKAFKGDERSAYKFGQWFRAINGIESAGKFCRENGVDIVNSMYEGDNTTGGYLVPPEFDNQIIDLVLEYGAFRRNAKVVPMSSDTKYTPRSTGALTAYWVAEKTAGTGSDKSWDQISLVAKNLRCLAVISNELSEDAIISVADSLAVDIGRAFAYAEDTAGFNGTGAASTGGIVGVSQRLTDVYSTAGLGVIAAAGAWAATTITNINSLMSALPGFAWAGAKFYCNPAFFYGVLARLQYAVGGATITEVQNNKPVPSFMGYPVEFVNALPSATGAQLSCYFGDLAMAANLGDRSQISIASSDSAVINSVSMFETAQLAIRGNERIDINVHSVGDATLAGPIVALYNNA